MSNNLVLTAYKMKMKEGNHSLANRRVSKRLERKHRRGEEVGKRRNLSNDMEDESVPENECVPDVETTTKTKAGRQTKINDRVERLRKWQEEKKKKRQQESDKSKPLFKIASIQRSSEAVLFQQEIQQLKSSYKVFKPVIAISKPAASVPKEIVSTNKKDWKPERLRPRQGGKQDVKAAPAKSKTNASDQGLKKSKSRGILLRQSPLKPGLKKVPETKPLRKFNSVITNSGAVNIPSKTTRQYTDLSKKLTIAATSKRNVPETSPRRGLRRVQNSVVKEMLPNKGVTKPVKSNVNIAKGSHQCPDALSDGGSSDQVSPDSQQGDGLSDANVPSPKHSTPHILKSANKRKSASIKRSQVDGLKEGRRDSKRKSVKRLSPVPVATNSVAAQFFSDSENEFTGLVVSLSGKKQKTPARKLRNNSLSEKSQRVTSAHRTSQVVAAGQDNEILSNVTCALDDEDKKPVNRSLNENGGDKIKRSTRKSIRLAVMNQKEEHAVSDMEGIQSSAESDDQVHTSTPDKLISEQQTPSRRRQNENSRQRLLRSTRKSTRLTSLIKEDWISSEAKSSQSSTDTGNNFLNNGNDQMSAERKSVKSLNANPADEIRKSTRKSTRLAAMVQEEESAVSDMEGMQSSAESDDQALTSASNKSILEHSTPSRQRLQRSTRKSTRFTSLIAGESQDTPGKENYPSSTETEEEAVDNNVIDNNASGRKKTASSRDQKMSHKKKTPMSTKRGKINSSLAESPMILSISSLERNAMDQENEFEASNSASNNLKHPRRKSMRMLTYNEPEIIELPDGTSTPRKRQCLTPLSVTKSFSALTCDNGMDKQVPMTVDAETTPESDQRVRMQSALAKRKSMTSVLLNCPKDARRVTPRSAGRSNRSDRRSTARGRRSRRSYAATPSTEEQATTDAISGERVNVRRSSSTPRRTSRRSTVVSVSDEGTAVGRNLELAVSYHVERQPVSAKASRILKELVVEKVDGESSFFEIPLDESSKSPKKMSVSNTPVVSEGQDENKQKELITTPLQSYASPMTTPKFHKRGRSVAPSSMFKEPGLPLSAVRSQTASSRRRKTEQGTPLRSPEEMIEILKKSPMVEMTRRKSRHYSTPVNSRVNSSDVSNVTTNDKGMNQSDPLIQTNETCPMDDNSSTESNAMKGASQEQYFRDLITKESDRLKLLCSKWNAIVRESSDLFNDVLGQIRSVVGKAQLLMGQRFMQFSGLVDNYAFGLGEKETNPSDLQGFWDMIYFQIEDVDNQFNDLDQLRASGWQMKQPTPKVIVPKKNTMAKAPRNSKKVKSNFASFRNDLLKRKAAAMAAAMAASSSSENVQEGFKLINSVN